MITAQEARKQALAANEVEHSAIKAMIEIKIKAAVEDGLFAVGLDTYPKVPILNWLKELGYKVSSGSQYNESYTSISW